jgi:hypothetical protein
MNTLSALSVRPAAPSRMKTALRIALALLGLMSLPAAAQQAVVKPLYLWSNPASPLRLSEQSPTGSHPVVSIASGGSATWTLTPALQTSVTLLSGVVPVRLLVTRTCSGLCSFLDPGYRTVSVQLSNNVLGAIASATDVRLNGVPLTTPNPYTIDLNIPGALVAPAGSTFALTISYETFPGFGVNIWPLNAANTSRVELNVSPPAPSLQVQKTSAALSDPFNGGSNPKSIPGAFHVYTVRVTNQGAGTVDNTTIQIVDAIPANTVMCGLTAIPVTFANGLPSSGLTFTYTALGSTTDDLDFSSAASGTNWGYAPPTGSDCDSNIRRIRARPRGIMAGAAASGAPSFEISFRVRVL